MNSARILVVDDAPQVRRVLRATLTVEGYTVSEAREGGDALELFSTEPFDIILLDVNMPGMDGLQVCREIRRKSDMPIIMLTVRDAERDKVLALDAGADDLRRKALRDARTAGPYSRLPFDEPRRRISFQRSSRKI